MVKVKLRDESTVEVSEEVAKIYKELRKLSKESKEQDKRFFESLTPEQKKGELEFRKEMRMLEEKREEFEKSLSHEEKELRETLLAIGSYFYEQRRIEKTMSRGGPPNFWDIIHGDMEAKTKRQKKTVKKYKKERKKILKELKRLYKKIKQYSIKKYEKVLMDDERAPFLALNQLKEYRKRTGKEDEKNKEKGWRW